MTKKKISKVKSLSLWIVIGLLGTIGIGTGIFAYSGSGASTVIETCNNCNINASADTSGQLGGITWDKEILQNDVDVKGDLAVDGFVSGKSEVSTISTYAASTTLSVLDSGKTFILTTTTEFVLPATTTASGVHYKFVIGGAITASSTIVTTGLVNGIEGTLIVAGAVVDCDAEDKITFGANFENIGDYVELWSDGKYWFIGDSGALTGTALACSAT